MDKKKFIIIPESKFEEKCEVFANFTQEEFDATSKELEVLQPNLFQHIIFALKAEDLNQDQKDFMIEFIVPLWILMKDYPIFMEKIIELEVYDKEYKNNVNYFRNIGLSKDSDELGEFVTMAYEGYRQKQLFLMVFHIFFHDNTFSNLPLNNNLNWFCVTKSLIDVIDRVLND